MPNLQDYRPHFEKKLVHGEQLIDLVDNLSCSFQSVVDVYPHLDRVTHHHVSIMALTSHRIILLWQHSGGWRWFHFSALNSVSERLLNPRTPKWPYQALLTIPGGLVLVVQTKEPDAEHGARLAALLNEAIVRLGVSRDDTGALAVIIAHQEEEERRRQE